MPRKYIKKKTQINYTPEVVRQASNEVKRGLSYSKAEELFGVPHSVIQRFIKSGDDESKLGAGRPTALRSEVEDDLEQCLHARAQMGYPCDRMELKQLIQNYVQMNNLVTPFKDDKPGNEWIASFLKRHPKLSFKKPEQLQKARYCSRDPFVIFDFYEKIRDLYDTCQITEYSAPLIFNADETGFGSDPSRLRAIGTKGTPLNRLCDGSGRDSTTVLACVSASGEHLPPLIVYKGVSVQSRWMAKEEYPGTMYAATRNGWMEETTFYQWVSKMFIPHVQLKRELNGWVNKPAILFFDGHASHISLRIVELALRHDIRLVKFPSHMSDKMQPLDVCVFGPVKTKWEALLVQHGKSRMGLGAARLQKAEFGTLINQLWRTISPPNIKSGFKATGLFPLDVSMVKDSWFNANDLCRYRRHQRAIEQIEIGSGDSNILSAPEVVQAPNSIEEDLPLDLSVPRMRRSPPLFARPKPMDIIRIFSQDLARPSTSSMATTTTKPSRRLKHHVEGEVLTCPDVMNRLEEAEIKMTTRKRGRSTDSGPAPRKSKK